MADYIPFINTKGDLKRFRDFYADSYAVRIPLKLAGEADNLFVSTRCWLDAGIDSLHLLLLGKTTQEGWTDYLSQFKGVQSLYDKKFVEKPAYAGVKTFVFSVLDKCWEHKPAWITVPQLPVVEGTTRNKVNKMLSQASGEWREERKFEGRFVLPLIFTNKSQLSGKTQWGKTLKTAARCYTSSQASTIWTVDSHLSELKCQSNYPKRFESLVKFHEGLRDEFPDTKIIGGPYWGINLVLWAKSLCDHSAISLGSAYRYYISGGFMRQGRGRVALFPLRRNVVLNIEFWNWLKETLTKLDPSDSSYKCFATLMKNRDMLSDSDTAKRQIAEAYKQWLDVLANIPPAGRALAMYQDLSNAYVLGKRLTQLPKSEAPGRSPGKVAEQLMLHCL